MIIQFQPRWLMVSALAAASILTPLVTGPQFSSVSLASSPASSLASQTASQFKTLTAPATFPVQFSMQYPADWMVDQDAQNYIMITSYSPASVTQGVVPAQAIKTDILLMPQSLERIIQQNQQMQREDDSRVIRQGRFKLAGRDGFRLWTTDSSFDFPDSIISYIRYDDRSTIVIASFYTASNPNAVAIIQQIHGSFRFQ